MKLDVLKTLESSLSPQDDFACPKCKEMWGYKAKMESGLCMECDKERIRQEEAVKERRLEVVKLIGGGSIFEKTAWEKIKVTPLNQKAVEACKAFRPDTDNLFLWGECGRGKTLLAKAVARYNALQGAKVSIETTSTLSRKTRGLEGSKEQEMVDRFCEADIFILDDLGRGNVTPTMLSILCEVLDSRFDNNRQGFIATSNCNLAKLAMALGDDRLTSRLLGCRSIEVKGSDWRLNK